MLNSGSPEALRRTSVSVYAALLIFGLAYGTLFAYPRQLTRGFLINDEAWYAEPARNILEGRGYVTNTIYPLFAADANSFPVPEQFKQIGYPWMSAAVGSVFGLTDQVMVWLALAGLAAALPALFAALRQFVSARASLLITLLTLGSPVALSTLTAALPESWFCFFFWSALALLHGGLAAVALAGALMMTAVYFKGFALLYFPVAAGFLLLRGQAAWSKIGAFASGMVLISLAAQVVLPAGGGEQLSTSSSSYAANLLLYETAASPQHEGVFYQTGEVNALAWVLDNPGNFAIKFARMASRTKVILEVLGGPSIGGLLLPLLLLAASVGTWRLARTIPKLRALMAAARRGGSEESHHHLRRFAARFLVLGLIAINFAFFWSTNFKERYFLHLLPLMLVLGWMEFGPVVRSIVLPRPTRRIVVAVLATFFVVYPLAQGLERAWRDPHAFLGRRLAVRFLDYPTVMAQIESHVPEDAVVMTHLGHEIAWYTRRKTVFPPGDPADFEYLANRFDVQAFYRHPDVAFDASALAGFAPVPGTDDLLWLKVAR